MEQWPDGLVLANSGTIVCGREQMPRGGLSQPRNAGLFKLFNLMGVGEHAGSGVPDIFAAWDKAGYDTPTVEERFGAGVPDRTTFTLPLVASLGTSLGTDLGTSGQATGHAGEQAGEQAGEHAGQASDHADGIDSFEMVYDVCVGPRTREEIVRL